MPETMYEVLSRKPRRGPARKRRYPVWRMRWVGTLLTLSTLIVVLLVFLIGKKSLFVELELSLALIALVLFVFLTIGLYYGARLKWEPLYGETDSGPARDDARSSCLDGWTWTDPGIDVDLDEGCLGAVISVLAGLLLLIVLSGLLFWLLPFLWAGILVILTGVFWVLNRALRVVFARSRECQGNLPKSLGYALVYTIGYTGWLFVLLYLGHRWLQAAT